LKTARAGDKRPKTRADLGEEQEVSKEEKMLILQMVADGKITPEQGAELLRAVMGTPESPRAPRIRETIDSARLAAARAMIDADEIAKSVGKKMEGIGEKAQTEGERIGRVLGESGANLGRLLAGMFTGGLTGPQQEVHETVTGELPDDGVLDITLKTMNGHITVQSAEQAGFSLDVKMKVPAASREEAERLLKGKYEFTHEGNVLRAVTTDPSIGWNSASIGFTLTIPRGRKASLKLDSTNGRLTIERVDGPDLKAWTANGRIVVDRCDFDEAEVKSANGRIEYEGRVSKLNGSTANGRIIADLSGVGDWVLETANGRIEASIRREPDVAYEVDISTVSGRIEVLGLEDGEVLVDETRQRMGFRRYAARSKGFDTAAATARFKGTSAAGKVTVSI